MKTTCRFLLSNDANSLRTSLASYGRTATVEAEYGDDVVEGTNGTLAHHGARAGNAPPCTEPNRVVPDTLDAIGLSHLDLDALGGCAALLSAKTGPMTFWALAGWVDVHGAHKLGQAPASMATAENVRRLYAWWAWNEEHRVYAPRDGSTLDVTIQVEEALDEIELILLDDVSLLAAGDAFHRNETRLNRDSDWRAIGNILVRTSDKFVNHLYTTVGDIADPVPHTYAAVVAFKETTGEITLSLADPIPGVSCVEVAQRLWGPTAGGHKGIAGGPRSGGFSIDDAVTAARALDAAITDARGRF